MGPFINFPVLSLLIFLPLFGVLFILLTSRSFKDSDKNAKNTALFITLCTFLVSLILWIKFDFQDPGYQFTEDKMWFGDLQLHYCLGVDGISLFFLVLTTLLMPLCILASWKSVKSQTKEFLIFLLLMETFILGAFCVLDLVLFYVFFEGTLIPVFLMIGIWGGERRIYAAFKFFFYTILGSILMLIAVLFLYFKTGSTSIPDLSLHPFEALTQRFLWLAFFVAFAVKIPLWPFHTWLPDAHVEAPTAASMILAGVLLKMGAYGFIRISLPFFPEACHLFAPYVEGLSIVAILYASFVTLVQRDMKKFIAYSSIAHMGFVTLGIFTLKIEGLGGALIQILSHGVISAALFLSVGILYERIASRDIDAYGGLAAQMPVFSSMFLIFTLGAAALPGTSGFVGEFLVILASFQVNPLIAFGAGLGVIFSAAYMLGLYRRIAFGPLEKIRLQKLRDLSSREFIIFTPLLGAVLWIGLYPTSFLKIINPPLLRILEYYPSQRYDFSKGEENPSNSYKEYRT